MTETTTSTRYTPDEVILNECLISIPDNERGYIVTYPGYAVHLPGNLNVLDMAGYIWHDNDMWCWKTPNASAYGRHEIKRFALAALLGVVQQ